MGEEEGLLADIASSPGDETPWLVLADWLGEQGQADRSELVRLSVLLRRPDGPGGERAAGEARLRQLVLAGVTLPLPRRRFPLGDGVALEMVLVPPGTFLMGSPPTEPRRDADEGPQHPVTLSRAFWLGTHAVTQEQWLRFQQALPGRFRGAKLPVDGVAWTDCLAFLAGLSARLERRFRLPTEAEWEYACRAGTRSPFFFGPSVSSDLVNFDGNYPYGGAPAGPWLERTVPVGSYPPNAWGLYDMHGNVWEWCHDWFDDDYYARSPTIDPPGPSKGALRVLRGGSWYSYSWSCRSAGRERFAPESGAGNYGFRVALDHGPEAPRRRRR